MRLAFIHRFTALEYEAHKTCGYLSMIAVHVNFLFRPEYLFRPSQIARRFVYPFKRKREFAIVGTPWKLPLIAKPRELHGRALLTLGICDLRLAEIIYRLIHDGDCVVDVGANIGVFTSLMAKRAGPRGKVYSVEPHPKTRGILEKNVELWMPQKLRSATVEIVPFALSGKASSVFLEEPADFEENWGIARISERLDGKAGEMVEARTFDELFHEFGKIRVVKVDVEGHEDDVFIGMTASLQSGLIENIVFEEFRPSPSPACFILQSYGYYTYLIDRTFLAPRLIPTGQSPRRIKGEPTNILAVKSERRLEELTSSGWRCLGPWWS